MKGIDWIRRRDCSMWKLLSRRLRLEDSKLLRLGRGWRTWIWWASGHYARSLGPCNFAWMQQEFVFLFVFGHCRRLPPSAVLCASSCYDSSKPGLPGWFLRLTRVFSRNNSPVLLEWVYHRYKRQERTCHSYSKNFMKFRWIWTLFSLLGHTNSPLPTERTDVCEYFRNYSSNVPNIPKSQATLSKLNNVCSLSRQKKI